MQLSLKRINKDICYLTYSIMYAFILINIENTKIVEYIIPYYYVSLQYVI